MTEDGHCDPINITPHGGKYWVGMGNLLTDAEVLTFLSQFNVLAQNKQKNAEISVKRAQKDLFLGNKSVICLFKIIHSFVLKEVYHHEPC